LDKEVTAEWSSLMEVFFLKFFTPKEAYENRCYIFNFWPHVGESITQAWGRLTELIRKNPCHDLSRKIILINFYMRLPKEQKEFLGNSFRGICTNNYEEEAWNLLETISENTGNWDLDKGNKLRLEYEYFCVENFSTSTLFEHLSDKFGLDPYVLVEIAKSFAGHIGVPKSGFEVCVEPAKHSIVVPKVIKQVNQVSSAKIKEYIEFF
jgi:hypothetical protein